MAGDPNLQESGWEELRKEARKIEGDLDVKLSSYAKLGARYTQSGSPPPHSVSIFLYTHTVNAYFYIHFCSLDLETCYIFIK